MSVERHVVLAFGLSRARPESPAPGELERVRAIGQEAIDRTLGASPCKPFTSHSPTGLVVAIPESCQGLVAQLVATLRSLLDEAISKGGDVLGASAAVTRGRLIPEDGTGGPRGFPAVLAGRILARLPSFVLAIHESAWELDSVAEGAGGPRDLPGKDGETYRVRLQSWHELLEHSIHGGVGGGAPLGDSRSVTRDSWKLTGTWNPTGRGYPGDDDKILQESSGGALCIDLMETSRFELRFTPPADMIGWRVGLKFSANGSFTLARVSLEEPLLHLTRDVPSQMALVYYPPDALRHAEAPAWGSSVLARTNYQAGTIHMKIERRQEGEDLLRLNVKAGDQALPEQRFEAHVHRFAQLWTWADQHPYALELAYRLR